MAPEKVTEMVLNVDLKCSGCYKKVKKVITKIPQIRDQVFDVDKNKVKIMVVCCSPENIRDKLCYKGGGAIQSIEIIEKPKEPADKPKVTTDKPKEPIKSPADKPKDPEKAKPTSDKPKDPEKPKPAAEKPKEPEKAKSVADKPKEPENPKPADKPKETEKPKVADKPKESGKQPEPENAKPKDAEKPSPPKEVPIQTVVGPNPNIAKMVYEPVHGYPHTYPLSAYNPMAGYRQYYDHYYGGAPFEHGYGTQVPPPPPPSYGGFGYGNEYDGYNGNNISHYVSNDQGGEEEDGEGCSIM